MKTKSVVVIIAYLPMRIIFDQFFGCIHIIYDFFHTHTLFIVISSKIIINFSYDGIFYKHHMCIPTSFTKREEKNVVNICCKQIFLGTK
jgi:hypothetical protein